MAGTSQAARFEATEALDTRNSTVLVGFPGLGLAGVIAVDHVTDQLGLSYQGRLVSDRFPRVATFAEGRYRDPVRVYADEAADVTTVQADLVFPPRSNGAVAEGVVEHLTEGCEAVIVPVGAPAEAVDDHGDVTAIATTDSLEADVRDAGVALAGGVGAIGGPAGALVTACARADVPAVALVVRSEPYRPDPKAASTLVSEGIEPVADFEVDTTALERRADELVAEMSQMARRMQRTDAREGLEQVPPESEPSMFQ